MKRFHCTNCGGTTDMEVVTPGIASTALGIKHCPLCGARGSLKQVKPKVIKPMVTARMGTIGK